MGQTDPPAKVASNDQLGATGDEAIELAPFVGIGRAAILVVSPEILSELLRLPQGCHIDAAESPHDKPGVLHLRVRGAGWPMKAGVQLPISRGTITRCFTDDGRELRQLIDWDFPKGESA